MQIFFNYDEQQSKYQQGVQENQKFVRLGLYYGKNSLDTLKKQNSLVQEVSHQAYRKKEI